MGNVPRLQPISRSWLTIISGRKKARDTRLMAVKIFALSKKKPQKICFFGDDAVY
jgi:hypothetical protein